MGKDPAVLFYTSDFISGTLTMTYEQKGKYIILLCLQHQNGTLTEKDMLNICGTYDKDIFDKFINDGDDYYNQRMKDESDRRKAYSESRSKNRLNISKTYDKHMETETETEDENINTIKNNDNIFLDLFNEETGRKFRILDSKTKRQLKARYKEGFTDDDFKKAIKNCMEDEYHKEHPNYLTPEFITRADKLQKYLNAEKELSLKQKMDQW